MASNPMQRQARNSFLLGIVVTLIIAGIIVIFLFMQMKKLREEVDQERASNVEVWVLNQNVKSGQVITADLFSKQQVKSNGVPEDAVSGENNIASMLDEYSVCDKEGNELTTDKSGNLYLEKKDGTKTAVYTEDTGKYYTHDTNGAKTYIETTTKPVVAKIDMNANTVITKSLIDLSDEVTTNDVRMQEYNSIVLPVDLFTDDYVDIRLLLPNGQDYIVVSKKKVTVPDLNGEYLTDTIQMKMSEDEILSMSNAIVEAYKIDGSKLYATKYSEAGMQEASTPTYVVNKAVASLIEVDPNIVSTAKAALFARYNATTTTTNQQNNSLTAQRNQEINGELSNHGNDESVTTKMDESITSTKESRQQYLQSLTNTTSAGTSSTSTGTNSTN